MSDELEVRHLDGLRADVTDPRGPKLVGVAIRTGVLSEDLGGFKERITPDALTRALARGRDLVALVNHNADRVVGRQSAKTLTVAQEADGLRFEVSPPAHEAGLVDSVARGDLPGASFAFRTLKDQWDETTTPPTRTLLDFELRELSVGVPFPAYPQTSVTALRSLAAHRAAKETSPMAETVTAPVSDPIPPVPPVGHPEARRSGEVRLLAPAESLRAHVAGAVELPDGLQPSELSFGRAVAGLVTGSWRGREAEQRVMATTSVGSGGALVPSILSATVIDGARAQAVVFRAGAQTLPMDSAEVNMARVAQDPSATWRGENQVAAVSDVALERLALRAKTLVAVLKMSVELFEDAPNIGAVVENAMAAALALELDRVALRGQALGEGPVQPMGIRATSGVNVVAVGGVLSLDHFSSAVELIARANGPTEGLASVVHPRTAGWVDRLKDGQGLPLLGPASWQKMLKLSTTACPITLSPGTVTEPIVGYFPALIVGMRTSLQIEASRVAADSNGSAFTSLQVWLRVFLRADILVTREAWFGVLTGVTS